MPKRLKADDAYVPMDVMQPQRIKVLESQVQRLQREVDKLTRQLAKANASLAAVQVAAAARKTWSVKRGRKPKYTREVLLDVWHSHQKGEPVEDIARRIGGDVTMLKTFIKGDYWTEAAQEIYRELGLAGDLAAPPDSAQAFE